MAVSHVVVPARTRVDDTVRTLRAERARVESALSLERGREAVALLYNDGAAAVESARAVKKLEATLRRRDGELAVARTPTHRQPVASAATKAKPPVHQPAPVRKAAPPPIAPKANAPPRPAPRGEITSSVEAERIIAAVWPFLDAKRQAHIAVERATGSLAAPMRIATQLRDEFAPATTST